MSDCKDLNELVIGLLELSLQVVEVAKKDGFNTMALVDLYQHIWKDEDVKAKVMAAIDGYKNVPANLKEVDFNEGIQLAALLVSYAPKFVAALKQVA
jgi:hypothetical protein